MPAIAVGIAILSTTHGLLTGAEQVQVGRVQAGQVQAGQVTADSEPAAPDLVAVAGRATAADGVAGEWRERASLRPAGLLAAAAADYGPQVLGEVLQRR